MSALRDLLLVSFVLLGCEASGGATRAGTQGPVEVGVHTVSPTRVTLTRELPGRVSARRVAEVRARVDGIVEAVLFEEGTDVQENQPLYRIETAPYEASLAAARASLAQAEAARSKAKLIAERDAALVGSNAVSHEQHEQSTAELRAAEADVAARRAAVRMARIDLEYTTVAAPISGRIGRTEVTEGAYVQRTSATLMATVQQLDPVYVDITQSAVELVRLRHELATNELHAADAATDITLLLEDGRTYSDVGTLKFADATVGESTGSVTLRAEFPNPGGELLPGMFVRARLEQGEDRRALLVPQRGVTRDPKGNASVFVVGDGQVVERREIVAERAIGDAWLVGDGLVAGDRVIVDGVQKVRPGVEVITIPAEQDQSHG